MATLLAQQTLEFNLVITLWNRQALLGKHHFEHIELFRVPRISTSVMDIAGAKFLSHFWV